MDLLRNGAPGRGGWRHRAEASDPPFGPPGPWLATKDAKPDRRASGTGLCPCIGPGRAAQRRRLDPARPGAAR